MIGGEKMRLSRRLRRQAGRYALVDGIPYQVPVDARNSPALVAAFPINAEKAKRLLPGNELHPVRIFGKGVLLLTVVNYQSTDIGRYVEYIVTIACTHGPKPAPDLLPLVFRRFFGFGGYVYDMPVSTEISVKGGKGIWGTPKVQANLDFQVTESTITSQYDLDGMLAMRIEMRRPKNIWLPVSVSASAYSQFRGMLMKAHSSLGGKAGFSVLSRRACRLYIGDHPRVYPLKELEIEPRPFFTAFLPDATGVLDDHIESWFVSYENPPSRPPEGLESVVDLGLGRKWLDPPSAPLPGVTGDREEFVRR
ncbi:MAG TPA: acetoacetate decarboxylase family protein [Rubrobacter sp.]|nr:acetoacetate decarboxylase family protein [Rubrobacter sp.]